MVKDKIVVVGNSSKANLVKIAHRVINPTVAVVISNNRLVVTLRAEVTREIIIPTGNRGQIIIATGQTEVVVHRVGSSGQIKTPITAGIKNN